MATGLEKAALAPSLIPDGCSGNTVAGTELCKVSPPLTVLLRAIEWLQGGACVCCVLPEGFSQSEAPVNLTTPKNSVPGYVEGIESFKIVTSRFLIL